MRFRLFHLFYVLALFSLKVALFAGLWPFFISTAIVSVAMGLTYQLFFKTGRHVSSVLLVVRLGLIFVGRPLSLNLYRAFSVLADSGAPDTVALSGDAVFFL